MQRGNRRQMTEWWGTAWRMAMVALLVAGTCAVATRAAAQPADIRDPQLATRIRDLDLHIARLQHDLTEAMAQLSAFRAMAAPFRNLNPGRAQYLYGSNFPQISPSSRVGVNQVEPVVILSPASPRYQFIVGGMAAAETRTTLLVQQCQVAVAERERLYQLDRNGNANGGQNPPPANRAVRERNNRNNHRRPQP